MTDTQAAVDELVRYIEENVRASGRSGLRFIDPRNHLSRVSARQNHIAFGRRGAGKSSLLASLERDTDAICIRIDMEDLKSITFPNILIHVLLRVLDVLTESVETPLWRLSTKRRKAHARGNELIDMLRREVQRSDDEEIAVRATTTDAAGGSLSVSVASAGVRSTSSSEVSQRMRREKVTFLHNLLPDLKNFIRRVSALGRARPVFLVLDDFYFVRKAEQPDCIDYFHRLTKDTELFLKVATIKHRSRIYSRGVSGSGPTGVELGADVLALDLDYTLDRFADLQSFMRQILVDAASDAGSKVDVDQLFAGEGFSQLCLASGGVPRDFLSLFVKLGARIAAGELDRIGKVDVNEAAIEVGQGKFAALEEDAGSERDVLEHYLELIKAFVYQTKRTNAFLVSKNQMAEFPQEGQAIRELVDLRFLHLAEGNTSSAPSDGQRYEAYMLDVGLYDNSRPREFTQLEPGSTDPKSRKDDLRAAPRLDLKKLREGYLDLNTQTELELSDFQDH